MTETRKKITIAVIAFFAVFCLIGLIKDISRWKMFCPNAVTVQATVTDNEERYSSKGRYHYTPILSYNVNGIQCDGIKLDIGQVDPRYPTPVGSQIELTVNGNDPRKMLRDPNWTTLLYGMLFLVSSGIVVMIKSDFVSKYSSSQAL